MIVFRKFLKDTFVLQTEFILKRAQKSVEKVVRSFLVHKRRKIQKKLDLLLSSTNGTYAIIDYINFPKRIFPIGRLDKPSEGLIFLTSWGGLYLKKMS